MFKHVCKLLLFTLAAFTIPAHADTLLSISGTPDIAAGIGRGNGQQAAALGFSANYPLQNVSITAPFSVSPPGALVNVYLTDRIGSGTSASDVLQSASLLLSGNSPDPNRQNFTTETLFSGLDLAPGDYYVVLAEYAKSNDVGIGEVFTNNETKTTTPGVSFLATFETSQQSGTFAPGFSPYFNDESASLFAGDDIFAVTGTADIPVPAPEPPPLYSIVLLLPLAWAARRRYVALP